MGEQEGEEVLVMEEPDKPARRRGMRRRMSMTGAIAAAGAAALAAVHSPTWAVALGTAASVFAAIAGARR